MRFLALLAAAVSAGSAAAVELGAIPEEEIDAFADDEQVERWEPTARRDVMQHLASDDRVAVRKSIVKHIGRCPLPLSGEDEDWLKTLAADPSREVGEEFARELGVLLERASALDRTYFVTNWAVSPSGPVRLSIARALRYQVDAIGTRAALEQLCQDPVAEVRSAALETARRRS